MRAPSVPWSWLLLPALLGACSLQVPAAEGAGQGPSPTREVRQLVAREGGEGGALERRGDWFFSSRRPGADVPLASLRLRAVEFARARGAECGTRDDGGYWVPRGPFSASFGNWRFGRVSGRVPSLCVDWTSGALYAGSASGGLWKSLDDGVSWTPILDGAGTQTVGEVVLDPGDPSVIWVGTGENSMACEDYFGVGLLRSRDGGASWETRNGTGSQTLESLSTFASISVDPRDSNRLIVGGFWRNCEYGQYRQGGIYATRDGGETWSRRLSGYVTEIVRDPSNPDVLWAGVGYAGVYRSGDGGDSWDLQGASSLPRGSVGRVEVAVAPSSPSVVYALFESVGGVPQFWRTADGGASWAMMSSGEAACDGQCWYNMVLRVSPANPDALLRGTILLYQSTDGGARWKSLTGTWGPNQKVHQDTHALAVDPRDARTFYVGCDGGVWKTTDGGATFRNLNGNLCLTQFYDVGIHPASDEVIVGGSQDNSSLARTTGDTWELQEVTGDGFVTWINPVNPEIVYITSYPYPFDDSALPNVYRSTAGLFGTFQVVTGMGSGISPGDRINWVTPYALDVNRPSTLFLGTHRVYRSRDGGDTWSPVGPPDMAGGSGYLVSVAPARSSGEFVYAGTSTGRVWRSTDGGDAWSEISDGLPHGRWVNDIEADPANPSLAFCVLSGFYTAHLYEFDGASWVARGEGLPNVPANALLLLSPDEILVGTDVGVFRSTDRGNSFSPFFQGMPEGLVVTDLEYNPATHTVTAGTYGRGAWQYHLPSCDVGCTASCPAETVAGVEVSFAGAASEVHCDQAPAFAWDFGDGSPPSADPSPRHTYASAGTFAWRMLATAKGSSCLKEGSIAVLAVAPPAVTSIKKVGGPFRIAVKGSNFQPGIRVFIGGAQWAKVARKNGGALTLKGGAALKAAVPWSTPVELLFENPDGGTRTVTWSWH